MSHPGFGAYLYGVGLVFCVVLSLFRGGCTTPESAVRALQTNGFRDVKITDQAIFVVGLRGCDGSDAARYTATAVNPQGQQVTLYVCSGWPFKGSTIRTPD